jgi:hypothetical protein
LQTAPLTKEAGFTRQTLSAVHSAQVAAALTHTDKRRLVLHFDINKTILMIDTVAGKNLAQVVFIK